MSLGGFNDGMGPPEEEPEKPPLTREEISSTVESAIGSALASLYPSDMLLKFVLVLEFLDGDDSERGMMILSTPGMKRWEAGGLITHATMDLQADYTADRSHGHDA